MIDRLVHDRGARREVDVPRATMRMQFHKDFTFDDARALVPYLVRMGISHLYASPVLKARPGSTHGYDCVDVGLVNPELGGETALRSLATALHAADVGLVVDIVPNHMGVGIHNGWWQDVLAWGPDSRYAHYFDIDWQSTDPLLRGKLLAPFLGSGYGETLASGDIGLAFDAKAAHFEIRYFDNRFPVAIVDFATILEGARHPALERAAAGFTEAASLRHLPLNDRTARLEILGRRDAATEAARKELLAALAIDGVAGAIDRALQRFDAADADGRARLHALLENQSYRLASWRAAADEINWRRFFEVTELAGIRVEREDVFEAMHATIFRLYRDGVIDAVRVDHVDGLADPRGYCRQLRRRLEALSLERADSRWRRPWIVVEKILAPDEDLREDWRVDGTSGYDFMDEVSALLHDPAAAEPLATFWAQATSRLSEFRAVALAARRQILAENLSAEFHAAARALHRVASADIDTRDIGLGGIQRAFTELLVQIDVYRTYVDGRGREPRDTEVLVRALRAAHETVRPSDRPVLAWLDHWLGGDAASDALPEAPTRRKRSERLRAITRFQQLTPPLAAKSVEDTAFYRYGRLISRNEVGSDPGRFALTIDQFHAKCLRRATNFPHAMLATATHDHKRGADTRARLAVLSEMPQRWTALLERWMLLNTPVEQRGLHDEHLIALASHQTAAMSTPSGLAAKGRAAAESAAMPLPEDQLMLMQALVGAWPLALTGAIDPADARVAEDTKLFVERVAAWQMKALRESKRPSDWSLPNEAYERTCREYLDRVMDPATSPFFREAADLVTTIGPAAAVNGLVQAALHLTVPGIPDVYQGTEFWDFSLVDPDNRRPVDYDARERAVASQRAPLDEGARLDAWHDGRIKQATIAKLLAWRKVRAELFARGDYVPLDVAGPQADHVLAFMRRNGAERVVVVVPIRVASLLGGSARPRVDPVRWQGTTIALPPGTASTAWIDVMTGRRRKSAARRLELDEILSDLPIAVLHDAARS